MTNIGRQVPAALKYLATDGKFEAMKSLANADFKEHRRFRGLLYGAVAICREPWRGWKATVLMRALIRDGDRNNHPARDTQTEERYGIVAATAVGVLVRAGVPVPAPFETTSTFASAEAQPLPESEAGDAELEF